MCAVQVKPIATDGARSQASLGQAAPNTGQISPGVTSGNLTGQTGSPYSVNFGTYYPSVVPPPNPNAPMVEKIAFTHHQLDSIRGDSEVVDGLVLVSSGVGHERLEGGVQQHFVFIEFLFRSKRL